VAPNTCFEDRVCVKRKHEKREVHLDVIRTRAYCPSDIQLSAYCYRAGTTAPYTAVAPNNLTDVALETKSPAKLAAAANGRSPAHVGKCCAPAVGT
jgi:hypothetical protein